MKTDKSEYTRALFFLLLVFAFAYVLLHSIAGGTLLEANNYDSYALQAENWLAGRSWILDGEKFTWLELAVFQGRYYVSFPPVPSVAVLPVVALLGGAAAVPSNLINACYGLLTAAGIFCFFARRGASPARCVFWAALVGMGSNLWWMSTNGGVWFQAQALNFCLVAWGLFFASGEGTARHTAAAFLLALAVGCRPFSILLLALFMLRLLAEQGLRRTKAPTDDDKIFRRKKKAEICFPGAGFWLPFFAAFAVGAALAAYNYFRFGSILEFGHNYLPEFQRLENGQFGLAYLGNNLLNLLRPVLLTQTLDLTFPLFDGFLLWAANPVFFLWAIYLVRRLLRGGLGARDVILCVCWGIGLAALCLHETLGGWQFGARYTVDLIPYAMLFCARQDTPELGAVKDWEWLICALAVLFNLYGAVYMLTH